MINNIESLIKRVLISNTRPRLEKFCNLDLKSDNFSGCHVDLEK